MNELFNIEPVLSPRLKWIQKHRIRTATKDSKIEAWIGDYEEDFIATGKDMDEALYNLAKAHRIRLWFEEEGWNPRNHEVGE